MDEKESRKERRKSRQEKRVPREKERVESSVYLSIDEEVD
jgi:hypothetical protein